MTIHKTDNDVTRWKIFKHINCMIHDDDISVWKTFFSLLKFKSSS